MISSFSAEKEKRIVVLSSDVLGCLCGAVLARTALFLGSLSNADGLELFVFTMVRFTYIQYGFRCRDLIQISVSLSNLPNPKKVSELKFIPSLFVIMFILSSSFYIVVD